MPNTFIILAVLIAFSGFFSGIEIAYFSLGPGKIRAMVRRGLFLARLVERLKGKPRKLLVTILVGNNLVNIFAAAVATEFALEAFGSRGVAIATGVLTFLILVFGEIFPKTIAQSRAEKISRFGAPALLALEFLLAPLVWILEKLADLFSVKIPEKSSGLDGKVVEEEITSLFQLGAERGAIEWQEREFAERLFRFNDVPVSAITKPLNQAVMLDGDAPVGRIMIFAANSGYSRFPVFRKSRERIVGIVHLKDIAEACHSDEKDKPLFAIAKPPLFISEEEKLDDAFRFMKNKRAHYVLVKDRSGKIAGTVTLEDVIEELVGEIYDESDIRKRGPTT